MREGRTSGVIVDKRRWDGSYVESLACKEQGEESALGVQKGE